MYLSYGGLQMHFIFIIKQISSIDDLLCSEASDEYYKSSVQLITHYNLSSRIWSKISWRRKPRDPQTIEPLIQTVWSGYPTINGPHHNKRSDEGLWMEERFHRWSQLCHVIFVFIMLLLKTSSFVISVSIFHHNSYC